MKLLRFVGFPVAGAFASPRCSHLLKVTRHMWIGKESNLRHATRTWVSKSPSRVKRLATVPPAHLLSLQLSRRPAVARLKVDVYPLQDFLRWPSHPKSLQPRSVITSPSEGLGSPHALHMGLGLRYRQPPPRHALRPPPRLPRCRVDSSGHPCPRVQSVFAHDPWVAMHTAA